MYRPGEWDAEKGAHIALRDNNTWFEDEHTACYEAGADAIVRHLLSQEHQDWLDTEGMSCRGRWVFIPEGVESASGSQKGGV